MILNFLKEIAPEGFQFLDIGSSGGLDGRWESIKKHLNLVGFDPNKEDCAKQNAKDLGFKTSVFLPYAISSQSGESELYCTKSPYCYSLLKPNKPWLDRFFFHELFDVQNIEKIPTVKLSEVSEIKSKKFDILKIDTQGLELPILKNAGPVLKNVFYLETENGFTQNYEGETTFAEIDLFLREQGFLLFDLNTSHRISRRNQIVEGDGLGEQLLWTESVWLRDLVAEYQKNGRLDMSRAQALKVLILCAFQGCISYGVELATLFEKLNLINQTELANLKQINSWSLVPGKVLRTKTLTERSFSSRLQRKIHGAVDFVFRSLN